MPDNHEPDLQPDKSTLFWPLFFKASTLALLIASILLILTGAVAAGFAYRTMHTVLNSAGFEPKDVISQIKAGWQDVAYQPDNVLTILILGSDELKSRPGSQPLTDSLMLVALHLNTGNINLLSLPRDLWSEAYVTKINALYAYGIDRYPTEPTRFPAEVISETTGVSLDKTIVLTMETVAQVIDAVGGIQVDVTESFVDEKFPRTDVDVTVVHDPNLLYKTVSFKQGVQHMSGETALEYIRSRHASGDTGTDNARSSRQQAVISSLLSTLRQRDVITNPKVISQLLSIYHDQFQATFPLSELVTVAKRLYPVKESVQLHAHSLSIFPQEPAGVITHPPDSRWAAYNGQWVYIVTNQDSFVKEIKTKLGVE